MRKTILQVGLAVLTALNVAGPLVLDAQQLAPSWPWQFHALIGFIVFALVMVWIVLSYSVPLHRMGNSKPNLIWSENRGSPLFAKYNDPTENIKERDYLYHMLQVWFKNQPIVATDNSVAKNIMATVTFYDRTTKTALVIPTCFITAEARDHAGNTGEPLEKIAEWPPGEFGKLQIALKKHEEDSAFGFAKGDITAREIKKGNYYVKVLLEGTRVINFVPVWFAMANPGKDRDLSISDKPIKRPNLHKEGFQTE